jgi:predicted glycogen debranching enzyme
LAAPDKFTLELQPFYSCRDIHDISYANDAIGQYYIFENGLFRTLNYQGSPEVFIQVPRAKFTENETWYYRFEYSVEQSRSFPFQEDLYTHGIFTVELRKGSRLGIILSLDDPTGKDAFKLFRAEKKRRESLLKPFSSNGYLKRLALAADQFIVKRGDLNTIMAGYHWFTDWGRDTMISLPGLCLVTGRFGEAKRILQKFTNYISEGMLPNRFPDSGMLPEYNTMDATLWYFYALYKYYTYTHDRLFIRTIITALRDIIDWHYKGTRYNIHVDPLDELLAGGEDGIQLTWMDAKVEGWVVTPRRGKPVEINSLWYNSLCIMEYFMNELKYDSDAEFFRLKAEVVSKSFNAKFWNPDLNCLYDYIDGDYSNADIRPNQLFAISLPFPLLSKDKGEKVFQVVKKHLLTPRGLRSLSPSHPDYKSVYEGTLWSRDGAYHQGTVWSYLLGPYIDALFYINKATAKDEAIGIINNFSAHLDEACVGSVSEIFNAAPPHEPKGCVAQAWSVAELLRVVEEYPIIPVKREIVKVPGYEFQVPG